MVTCCVYGCRKRSDGKQQKPVDQGTGVPSTANPSTNDPSTGDPSTFNPSTSDPSTRDPRTVSSIPGRNFLRFHRFPKNPDRAKQWVLRARLEDVNTTHMHVCSDHFLDDDYQPDSFDKFIAHNCPRSRHLLLREDAVPNQDRQTGTVSRTDKTVLGDSVGEFRVPPETAKLIFDMYWCFLANLDALYRFLNIITRNFRRVYVFLVYRKNSESKRPSE